ncbi:MAG: hypothetical protein ACLGIK_10940 [Gemmatimonadota bacterium]
MRRALAFLGGAAIVSIAAAATPSPRTTLRTAQVQVHCAAGQNPAFVTPVRVEISVGDSVEWRMAGNVASDSLQITLKNDDLDWPFTGTPPRGGNAARANDARTPGTYSYNVRLLCRVAGGGTREEIIDPDIIIGE